MTKESTDTVQKFEEETRRIQLQFQEDMREAKETIIESFGITVYGSIRPDQKVMGNGEDEILWPKRYEISLFVWSSKLQLVIRHDSSLCIIASSVQQCQMPS